MTTQEIVIELKTILAEANDFDQYNAADYLMNSLSELIEKLSSGDA